MFQSTFPQGERPSTLSLPLYLIHCFNPRSRKGNDVSAIAVYVVPKVFQSTFPQGERHRGHVCQASKSMFQSTFPQGERPIPELLHNRVSEKFQSTFPQGERPFQPSHRSRFGQCFNPRSRKGNDPDCIECVVLAFVSIHVPARGTTIR